MQLQIDAHNYLEILEAHRRLHELLYEHWLNYELFTPQWWAQGVILIGCWLIWWRLVDKARIAAILSFGLLMMFAVILMDALGIYKEYWIYPIRLIPAIPHLITIDWSLLPVLHMLVYQYCHQWRSFVAAEIVLAVLLAFIGEPFAEWIGIYYAIHWTHSWSLPIYAMKGIIVKFFIERIIGDVQYEG